MKRLFLTLSIFLLSITLLYAEGVTEALEDIGAKNEFTLLSSEPHDKVLSVLHTHTDGDETFNVEYSSEWLRYSYSSPSITFDSFVSEKGTELFINGLEDEEKKNEAMASILSRIQLSLEKPELFTTKEIWREGGELWKAEKTIENDSPTKLYIEILDSHGNNWSIKGEIQDNRAPYSSSPFSLPSFPYFTLLSFQKNGEEHFPLW